VRPLAALILREWRTSWADRGAYVLRASYAGALFVAAVAAWIALPLAQSGRTEDLPGLVRSIFAMFGKGQFALATLLASMTFARTVSREQERGSLDLLLLTPLTQTGLLLGKLIGEFLGLTALLACGIPVIFLLLPLGGLNPLQILAVHLLLMGQILLVGGLCVGLSTVFTRAVPVMACVWVLIGGLVAGPILKAASGTPKDWRWELWDRLSPYQALDRQLVAVRPDLTTGFWMLGVSALIGVVACGVGSLVLERRLRRGSVVSLWVRVGRPVKQFAASVRGRLLFRPLARMEHPLMLREFSVYRDIPFRISWILLAALYAAATLALNKNPRELQENLVILDVMSVLAGSVLAVVMGALSVGYDRLRGRLQALVAAGVAPEDIVRARFAGLLVRMLLLVTIPAAHLGVMPIVGQWCPAAELIWRIPACVLAFLMATLLMMDFTLSSALKHRRPEVAAVLAALTALPLGAFAAGIIGYSIPGLALGVPLALYGVATQYARSIRNLPKWILA
jgi:ABC-type transport system involved in cytochrome c biogenesis permease component